MTVAITQIATVTSQAMRDSGTGRLFSPTAHEPCPDPRAVTVAPPAEPPLAPRLP
jgi:hypothetical protein